MSVMTVPDVEPNLTGIVINDDEAVVVSREFKENFALLDPNPVNDAVFKCNGCSLLTVHAGYHFAAVGVDTVEGDPINKEKRIYCCTNCAKFSSK